MLSSSCSCYFYIIDINKPRRFQLFLSALSEYTLEMLQQHIPKLNLEHEGKFQRILVTKDKVVFFFSFEKSEMKPASHAHHGEFSVSLKPEAEVFPKVNPSLNISIHLTVFRVPVSEAASALDTTFAANKDISDKLAKALSGATSGNVSCSEEFLKDIKAITDKAVENVTKLRDELCDPVAIPEILTTSCLVGKLKKCLEPSFIVSCEGGGGGVPAQ